MAFDIARSLAPRARAPRRRAERRPARATRARPQDRPRADAEAAVALGAECRALLAGHLEPGEILLVPAATGEPPRLDDGVTGDPLFCRAWTLLGVPGPRRPGAAGPGGAPVGVQLVAPAGADAPLVAAGAWAAAALA